MKPKNKFQKQVFEASKSLPAITDEQVRWAYKNCLEHIGRRLKSGVITCLDCSHKWMDKTTAKRCICPYCKANLVIHDTLKQVFSDTQYLCIITTYDDFQVLRYVYVHNKGKVGEKATYFHSEVVQRWLAPDGKHATVARLRVMSYYVDTWRFSTKLEIRNSKEEHNIIPTLFYPCQNLIPELKRSGYNGSFCTPSPFVLFNLLLSDSRAETLLKAHKINILKHFIKNGFINLDKYWASLKICFRNNYEITDVSMWCDYIDLLQFFNKDLRNAKYICPADFTTEHDKYVAKKREWHRQQEREKNRIKALEDYNKFNDLKSRFFGIEFTDGLIQIRVLESIEEVMQEGDVMRHCVFVSNYHLKPDTLLFSACIGEKRIETVELSLSQLKVLQSRGKCNKNTEYHDRIIKLVKKNIPLIKRRLAA